MKIIIAPAKKMNIDTDSFEIDGLPVFVEKAKELMSFIKGLSYIELKELWNCNDRLVELNYERFKSMDLGKSLTPAVISYEGIQYQYIAPFSMEDSRIEYIRENLYILSGFYGLLRAFDGVTTYRLEMQSRFKKTDFLGRFKDLYSFWGDSIYRELVKSDKTILNLASKEYSRAVEPFLESDIQFVTCVFGELIDGKVVQKGTIAKMARGEMVNFLAEKKVSDLDGVKRFNRLGYTFDELRSCEREYVFIAKRKD